MSEARLLEDEYLIAVGKIIHNAAAVDFVLLHAFCRITGLIEDQGRAVLFAVDSFNARREMINRVMQQSPPEEKRRACVDRIVKQAEKANRVRQAVAHTFVSVPSDQKIPGSPKIARLKDMEMPYQTLTKNHIDDHLQRSREAMGEAFEALIDLLDL